ncbi:MAG: sodium:solute symporter family protein [Planctomycetota bacterium]
MKYTYWIFAVLLGCATGLGRESGDARAEEAKAGPAALKWEELPPLPDEQGFAGAFAGVAGDALIVAGGAKFPHGRPWDEDPKKNTKVWYDDVFVLTAAKGKETKARWRRWRTGLKLPRPLGYGVSITTDEGVVCLGGGDADRHYADVFMLEWTWKDEKKKEQRSIKIKPLPPMPQPAAFFCGAMIGKTIYVAGGKDRPKTYQTREGSEKLPVTMKSFWSLDLSKKGKKLKWEVLQPWPRGRPRMLAVAAVQQDRFFLVGGVTLDSDREGDDKRVFLGDCYCYDPKGKEWTRIADLPRFAAAAPSPAMPLGQASFAVIGGDDGDDAFRVAELKDDHPGFPPEVLVYHTITNTWTVRGAFPKDAARETWPPVTTNTAVWRGRYVVPSGEARPGVRTPKVFWAEAVVDRRGFGPLDYYVLWIYIGSLVAMGFYFSRREKSTNDFFLGGHRVPWWAAGLSIFGTQLSAITFMAIPGKAYHTDWVYFLGNMMIVAVAPLVVFLYLPFFRRLNVTTAYEYLEQRFNLATRWLGSAAFVLFQLGRMGIVLYLPAAALHTVTGIDVYLCIALMGALATLYTVLGGIEAVIWTDVLQVFVLLGGALLALLIVALKVDGGVVTIVTEAYAADKLRAANFTWDIATTALWVVLLGKPFEVLVSYTADQTVVQRYLTTSDQKAAARGIWTNAVLTIPASILFFSVGTALWAFYRTHPAMLNPAGKIDEIFPWFIAQQLPMGVAGLVIAGLFAAAMSSLDSSMNSMATAITTDFYRRTHPEAPDRRCLSLARWLTVALGIVGTGFALYMAFLDSTSMWDQYSKVVGLFGGGLAGLFAVGIFTRRTTSLGAILGFLGSAALLFWIRSYTPVHFFLYPTIGLGGCFVIGYLISLVMPAGRRELPGLTLFTLSRSPDRAE